MNEEIKEVVEQLHDATEFKMKLSLSTNRAYCTIDRHWIGKEYKIPLKFTDDALKIAKRLLKKQIKQESKTN